MSTDPGALVQSLLESLRDKLLAHPMTGAALASEREAILRAWPKPRAPNSVFAPRLLPACDHLAASLASAEGGPAGPLAKAAAPLIDRLRWNYGYPPHPAWPDLADRIAFAQLIGGRGLMDDDGIHLGLTLLAPQTHYPLHSHPAVELYLVLAGTAGWRVAGAPFAPQPPGSFILHESGAGHAMQSGTEPMLALYVWRGDLETAPVYVDDAVGR